jgi:hydroxyacylglutathione hydrolase
VPVTPFQQNCTVTKRAVVIDPGGDLPKVERAITRAGISVDKIWLTHGHVDDVAGATQAVAAAGQGADIEPPGTEKRGT